MTKSKNFIRNPALLNDSNQEDYFGYATHAKVLRKKLLSTPKNSITLLTGSTGVGKSFLSKMMQSLGNDNMHEFYFNFTENEKSEDLWGTFRVGLSRTIKLNFRDSLIVNVNFMVELARSIVFRGKNNTLTTVFSSLIAFLLFLVLLYIAHIVALFLTGLVFAAIFAAIWIVYGTSSLAVFSVLVAITRYVIKKLNAWSKTDQTKALLLRIKDSKKDIIIVIDDINHASKPGFDLLSKAKILLDSNTSKREVRLLAAIPQEILKSSAGNRYLQFIDYFETFRPKIKLDKFIRASFSAEFLTKTAFLKCQRLLNATLVAADNNLRVLKLAINHAVRKHSDSMQPGGKSMQPLVCLEKSCECIVSVFRH